MPPRESLVPEPAPRRRVSLRFKILGLLAAVLLGAMVVYLALATRLFTRDKTETLYDLNASLVRTLAEEVASSLAALGDKLEYFAIEQRVAPADDPDRPARSLFASDQDVLALEVYRAGADGAPERTYRYLRPERLEELGLTADDLDQLAARRPFALAEVRSESLIVQNASLPPDAALLRVLVPQQDAVAAAVVRPDRLLRIFGRSSLYAVYLLDARGNVLVHPEASYVIRRMSLAALPIVQDALARKVSHGVREYPTAQGERIGAFASVPVSRATVIAEIPRREALRASEQLVRRSVLFAVGIVLVALLASIFFSRLLTAPLRRLEEAAAAIGAGAPGVRVAVASRDEIGAVADAFNGMARRLEEAREQLIQSTKLAAFGQMGAGITHEIKNPLTGILGFAQFGKLSLDDPARLQECLDTIERETRRCVDIVENLLRFVRPEPPQRVGFELNAAVQDALNLARHHLGKNSIQVEARLAPDLPPLLGDPKQLKQVFLNLVLNAGDAMAGGGRLTVATVADGDWVEAQFADDGPGIPPDVLARIFEPFFTTKPVGQGTGLGLSVSHAIVRDHGGQLIVDSAAGQGATFVVRLPIGSNPAARTPAPVAASGG